MPINSVKVPSSANASGGGGTPAPFVPNSKPIADLPGTGNNQRFVSGSTVVPDLVGTGNNRRFVSGSTVIPNLVGTGSGNRFIPGSVPIPASPSGSSSNANQNSGSVSAFTALAATTIKAGSFTANWPSYAGATSYQLDVATDSGFTSILPGYNSLAVASTSQAVQGLDAQTPHYYRVRAVTGAGNVSSNVITATTVGIVIYASTAHSTVPSLTNCAVNSNINSGGGTDDTVNLQAILDYIGAQTDGGELVIDGVTLVSDAAIVVQEGNPPVGGINQFAALMVWSNTTIKCPANCGVFMKAASHCCLLSNRHISGDPAAPFDHDIQLLGGVWNGNGTTDHATERNFLSNMWVTGMWFGAVSGLYTYGVTVRNPTTLCFLMSNANNITHINMSHIWDTQFGPGPYGSGLHMWGDLDTVYIKNYTNVNGNDDSFSFNTDEGYASPSTYFGNGVNFGLSRFPKYVTMGAITNVTVDGATLTNVSNAPNLNYLGVGNGTLNNITLNNFTGTALSYPLKSTGLVTPNPGPLPTIGNFTINGYNIAGESSLGVLADNLTIKNWTVPVGGASNTNNGFLYGGGKTTLIIDGMDIESTSTPPNAIYLTNSAPTVICKNSTYKGSNNIFNFAGGTSIGAITDASNNSLNGHFLLNQTITSIDGVTASSIHLSWTKVLTAGVDYSIDVSAASNFSSLLVNDLLLGTDITSATVSVNMVSNPTVYARIRAKVTGTSGVLGLSSGQSGTYSPPLTLVWFRGESDATDHMGNLNGTATNGSLSYVTGEVGQAFSFAGNGSYIGSLGSSSLLKIQTFSIEMWRKRASAGDAGPSHYGQLVAWSVGGWNLYEMGTFTSAQNGALIAGAYGVTNLATSSIKLPLDTNWHHVAVAVDQSGPSCVIQFWIDGTPDPLGPYTVAKHTFTFSNLGIPATTTDGFAGALDEVTIYNYALTNSQVSTIYGYGSAGKPL